MRLDRSLLLFTIVILLCTGWNVQDYLRQYGARKVEANALVTRPDAGRELCRQTILQYLDVGAPDQYERRLEPHRKDLQTRLSAYLAEQSKLQ